MAHNVLLPPALLPRECLEQPRRQAELDTAVKELGDNAVGVQGDVSKPEDLDRLYTAVADSGRRLDAVFANAAIIDTAFIGQITDEHLDTLIDIDFKGVVHTVQKSASERPLVRGEGASPNAIVTEEAHRLAPIALRAGLPRVYVTPEEQ